LVPARKQPGLKAGAFSLAWLIPVAETGINGLYKPGLKAFFPPVSPPPPPSSLADIEGSGEPDLC
jgi:hypothetical protein